MNNSTVKGYDLQSRPPLLWQTISWDDVNIAKDIVHLELQELRKALVPFNPIYKKPFKDYPEEQIAFTTEKDWEDAADYIISILAMQKLSK
jgi:hypothetical protein